ncbi:hypothetical protein [Burkholderia ubonensis]|uniref:hypothetical protein n=1 Tax=Burkholderia ubonensis TaxID=101571 RepID=UPI001055DE2F|nr:hypothetical protein [Burkholderia ubonensis]
MVVADPMLATADQHRQPMADRKVVEHRGVRAKCGRLRIDKGDRGLDEKAGIRFGAGERITCAITGRQQIDERVLCVH